MYSEKKVREKLGISPNDMRAIRQNQLNQEGDWERLLGGAIALSQIGLKKLIDHLWASGDGAPVANPLMPNEFDDCLVGLKIEVDVDAVVELVVMRVCQNKRMLRCKLASTVEDPPPRDWLSCQVKTNENFCARMTVKATRNGPAGIYKLVGKCPRRKGRWT